VSGTFRIELLSGVHQRAELASGSLVLDRYFQSQASQDMRRRIATCFVAVGNADSQIGGYYTLSATSVALDALALQVARKLPRYPVVPAALLGRLAVQRAHQGMGLGGALLADAIQRIARAEVGVFALIVDAKDEPAQRFYEHFGFSLLAGENRCLILPIDTALKKLASR